MKRASFPAFAFLIVCFFISCNDLEITPIPIPEKGESPLPLESGQSYYENSQVLYKSDKPGKKINWQGVKKLLKSVREKHESDYVALFSLRDENGDFYNYYTTPLEFSPSITDSAKGKGKPYLFEITEQDAGIPRIAVAWIPDSEAATREMDLWTQPSGVTTGRRTSDRQKISNICTMIFESYSICRYNGNYYYDCMEVSSITFEGSGCSGGSGGDTWDGATDNTTWTWPEENPYDYCYPPYSCGTGGSGSTDNPDGGSGNSSCDNPDNIFTPAGCEETGDPVEEAPLFVGDIEIAPSVLNDPKAKCVLNQLFYNGNGNTFTNTIIKFADESVNMNLVIELADLGPAEGDANGTVVNGSLAGDGSTNTFHLRLNKNRISNRTPIEIAATFLHEAIHAEMRRYLNREVNNPSTLSGFPGDFTTDWDLFIDASFGGDVGAAEHEIMAAKYLDLIISGLKEFGDSSFSNRDYEAIAWIGLKQTQLYSDFLTLQERTSLDNDIKTAKAKANETCL